MHEACSTNSKSESVTRRGKGTDSHARAPHAPVCEQHQGTAEGELLYGLETKETAATQGIKILMMEHNKETSCMFGKQRDHELLLQRKGRIFLIHGNSLMLKQHLTRMIIRKSDLNI